MKIYMLVTRDKYELPVMIADSAVELAERCGVTPNNVYSAITHSRQKGFRSQFVKVEV